MFEMADGNRRRELEVGTNGLRKRVKEDEEKAQTQEDNEYMSER